MRRPPPPLAARVLTGPRTGQATLGLLVAAFVWMAVGASTPAAGAGSPSGWVWPVAGPVVTPYRNSNDRYAAGMHRGVDIATPPGTPVRAAAGGRVSFAGTLPDAGRAVSVTTTDDRFVVSYLHLDTIAVVKGAVVVAGDRLGAVGTTGTRSTPEPHLHLGVRELPSLNYRDPLPLLGPRPAGAERREPPAAAKDLAPAAPDAMPGGALDMKAGEPIEARGVTERPAVDERRSRASGQKPRGSEFDARHRGEHGERTQAGDQSGRVRREARGRRRAGDQDSADSRDRRFERGGRVKGRAPHSGDALTTPGGRVERGPGASGGSAWDDRGTQSVRIAGEAATAPHGDRIATAQDTATSAGLDLSPGSARTLPSPAATHDRANVEIARRAGATAPRGRVATALLAVALIVLLFARRRPGVAPEPRLAPAAGTAATREPEHAGLDVA